MLRCCIVTGKKRRKGEIHLLSAWFYLCISTCTRADNSAQLQLCQRVKKDLWVSALLGTAAAEVLECHDYTEKFGSCKNTHSGERVCQPAFSFRICPSDWFSFKDNALSFQSQHNPLAYTGRLFFSDKNVSFPIFCLLAHCFISCTKKCIVLEI